MVMHISVPLLSTHSTQTQPGTRCVCHVTYDVRAIRGLQWSEQLRSIGVSIGGVCSKHQSLRPHDSSSSLGVEHLTYS